MKKLILVLLLAFGSLAAEAKVVTLQVTIGAAKTAITTGDIHCKWVLFQNNASNTMRVGDTNVSATQGVKLVAGSSLFIPAISAGAQTNLNGWFVQGTQNDVIDVIYDDGQ